MLVRQTLIVLGAVEALNLIQILLYNYAYVLGNSSTNAICFYLVNFLGTQREDASPGTVLCVTVSNGQCQK
jgi:hypothetical protein